LVQLLPVQQLGQFAEGFGGEDAILWCGSLRWKNVGYGGIRQSVDKSIPVVGQNQPWRTFLFFGGNCCLS
jgi:hypothetical protein